MQRLKNFLKLLLKAIFPAELLREILVEEMRATRNEFYKQVVEGTSIHTDRTLTAAREEFAAIKIATAELVRNFDDEIGKLKKEMRMLGRPYIKVDSQAVINDYLAPMKNEFNELRESYVAMRASTNGANDNESTATLIASRIELRFTEHKKEVEQKFEYIMDNLRSISLTAPAPTVKINRTPKKQVNVVARKKLPNISKKKVAKRK